MSFVYIVAVGIPWDFQDFPMLKVPPSLRVHCINERFRRLSFIVSLVFVKVNQSVFRTFRFNFRSLFKLKLCNCNVSCV